MGRLEKVSQCVCRRVIILIEIKCKVTTMKSHLQKKVHDESFYSQECSQLIDLLRQFQHAT